MKSNKPDYKGFCLHVEEWNNKECTWGWNDLVKIAKKYHTPIPSNRNQEWDGERFIDKK